MHFKKVKNEEGRVKNKVQISKFNIQSSIFKVK